MCLLAATGPVGAAKKSDAGPLPFWPVRPVWTLTLNSQLTHRPAFDDAHGYFPIEQNRLVAYALPAGTRQWIIEARPTIAPAAGGGFVFLVEDGALVGVRAADGSRAWTSPIGDELAVGPSWASGWLMLATRLGTIVAIRANDGHEIWRRDLGVAAHAPVAVSGDRVFVPLDNGHVVALQIETGAPIWERRLGGKPNEILALDDRLFVGAADDYFYSLTTDEGRVDWRWHAGADAFGLPAVDERRVYFVALDNVVRALNRSNGVQQWIQLLKLRPVGGPLRVGATVIVYGLQPPMRAFNAADGKGGGDIPFAGQLAPLILPHILGADDPLPSLVVVTRDIAKGDTVTLLTRSVEPQASPFAPFGNTMTKPPELR